MRYSSRFLVILLVLSVVGVLVGCGSGDHRQSANALMSITVSGASSAPIQRGQTVQFSATGTYTNGNTFPLTGVVWSTTDASIATVSSSGLVTAVGRGSADIVATLNLVRGKAAVSVKGLAGGDVGPAGATITVEDPSSASNGTTITVPANSTAGGDTIHVELDDQDALPADLPTGAVQASKVYILTKNSPYNFAKPVEITVPVDPASLVGDEFPLVFFWSTADNKYRPAMITNVDRTNNRVTFKTTHLGMYVAISVPSLSTLAQTTTLDSGFRANVDGFFHPNFGSYDSAGGACMGMANFSAWYFGSKKHAANDVGLFSKYLEGDLAKWQDDATARQLIENTFDATKNIWSLYSNAATGDEALSPSATALAVMIALSVSNEPQTMMLRFANGQAHAVTVYAWDSTTKTFGVYDNNFPGESATLAWDATNGFTAYSKAGAYPQISGFTFMPMGLAMEGPEFESLYQGAEAGWSPTKFDQVTFTAPAPDTNGKHIIPGQQDLTVSGTITPAGKPTAVVYSWNGTTLGVAPITNNTFTFTIPAAKVVGFSNTVSVITTTDPKNVFLIDGYGEMSTYIQGAVFFNNPGFETGDFTGWTHETHTWQNSVPGSFTPEKSSIIDSNLLAQDPLDPNLSTVYAGRYSARVNNEDDSYHISSVSQTVTVPAGSAPQIRFYWAAVLEDPGHPPDEQPYVDILVTDDTAGTQLYTRHFYSNDPSYSGWITVYPSYYDPWQVINWQPVVIDLSGAVGHQVTVKITAADCAAGGHGGYAYFDGDVQ